MKAIDTISYKGVGYPMYEVSINLNLNGRLEPVFVSVESLESGLMSDDGTYRDAEAISIDEKIYFYIPDDMADKDEQTIRIFIENNTGTDGI